MENESSHALLVVGENSFCLASSQVPQPDSAIMAACHNLCEGKLVGRSVSVWIDWQRRMAHLRVGSLGDHGSNCVGVASEGMNACLGTHIPHLHKQLIIL